MLGWALGWSCCRLHIGGVDIDVRTEATALDGWARDFPSLLGRLHPQQMSPRPDGSRAEGRTNRKGLA